MIPLLDTHQHLMFRDRFNYFWSDSLPPLAGRDFTLADYADLTKGRGIAGSIFMEVDADDYRGEARHVSALADDPANGLQGVIASCRPESDGEFTPWLEELADLPVVGLRRILHEVPDDVSQSPVFRANLARLSEHNLTFDMVFRADQLPLAAALARACPDTQFVLDHCGVPDIAGGGLDPWRAGIAQVANLDNVVCKLSGVLAYCAPDNANHDAIQPYISHCIEQFGAERCMWGSDWPVVNLTSALPDWIKAFRSLISDLSGDEQRAICHGTARRVYGVSLSG